MLNRFPGLSELDTVGVKESTQELDFQYLEAGTELRDPVLLSAVPFTQQRVRMKSKARRGVEQ